MDTAAASLFVMTEEGYDRMIQECDKLNADRGIEYPLLGSNNEPETLQREEGGIVFGRPDKPVVFAEV